MTSKATDERSGALKIKKKAKAHITIGDFEYFFDISEWRLPNFQIASIEHGDIVPTVSKGNEITLVVAGKVTIKRKKWTRRKMEIFRKNVKKFNQGKF